MTQLPLDFGALTRLRRDDFTAAPANAAALGMVEDWPHWPHRTVLLLGPAGAGKSHLAAIWAARARARLLAQADLTLDGLPALAGRPVVIDDADRMAGRETAFFHLLNLVREESGFLLLTARAPPDLWGLRTPDLLSRLRLAPTATLEAPDDTLMGVVLRKLFADRQLVVDETVIAYLTLHLDRSLSDARQAVGELDRLGLALGRRVTRAMAATVLGRRAEAAEEAAENDEGTSD